MLTGISSFAQFLPLVLLSIKEEFMQDEIQFLNRDNDIHGQLMTLFQDLLWR